MLFAQTTAGKEVQEEKARALGADVDDGGDSVTGNDSTAHGRADEDNMTDGQQPKNPDFEDAAVPLGAAGKREMDDSGDDDDAKPDEDRSIEQGPDC